MYFSNQFTGNVSPIDVYSHIPGICEEKDIPYIFTPSREHLGLAAGKISDFSINSFYIIKTNRLFDLIYFLITAGFHYGNDRVEFFELVHKYY